MHFGEYERTVDYKGRLSLPAHLLASSGETQPTKVMVMKGEHDCLYLFDLEMLESVLVAARRTMDDDEVRLFMHRTLADAQQSEVDALNRITIPTTLLQYAGIEKRVTIVGMFNRLELWNPDVWSTYLDTLADVELPSIADLSRTRIRDVASAG